MTPADIAQLTTEQLGVLARVAQRTAAMFNRGKKVTPPEAAAQQRLADMLRKTTKARST